jgi:hypothetical protein
MSSEAEAPAPRTPPSRGWTLPLLAIVVAGCPAAPPAPPSANAYLDSLRVILGELRYMDHELGKLVQGDAVRGAIIVPLIEERFRPTVDGLRQRAQRLATTDSVRAVHQTLMRYLDVRLEAYDAALEGHREQRAELLEAFVRKQVEADSIGRSLQAEAQRLSRRLPAYE